MMRLTGYSLKEILYQGSYSAVYRGTRDSDGTPVICKLLNREYPTALELSAFRREYMITAKLGGDGAVGAYALVEADNSLAMILEDSGGTSLDRCSRAREAGIGDKLAFALSAAEALSRIHYHGVIHRDLSPSNILVDAEGFGAVFIDFGISSELSSENLACSALDAIEGNLSYISPEQTGRTNSPVDSRSDLYSLGAVLYELFTGALPFAGKDDLELIYGHIARVPVPLGRIDPRIPRQVAAIISKLLMKGKEERYQSAGGLARDLARCVREYADTGSITDFALGDSDAYGVFSIPHRLYGRRDEVNILLKALKEVTDGASRLLLVSGEPGIGKTALIREIHASVPSGKVFFVSGKFNQLERNMPYAALAQALQALAAELRAMPQAFLEELVEKTGPSGAALVELVPSLSAALGAREPPLPLDPVASQNRLQLAIREFLAAVAERDRPIVLFLDDLQWSDLPTLDLVKFLMGRNAVPHLLVIGAFRENEVAEGHPLIASLRALEEGSPDTETRIARIRLGTLDQEALNLLVADALRRDPGTTRELASALYGKTGGNPFYVDQALLSLRDEGAFAFDPAQNRWNWDMAKVRGAELGENVIDLLVGRLGELPSGAIGALKAAACLGDSFEARTLSLVCGSPYEELESGLWGAIEREIIVPRSGDYRLLSSGRLDLDAAGSGISFKFQHDRIRQALLSMASEEETRRLRSRIGKAMLKDSRRNAIEERVFEIANHLNAGASADDGLEERMELALLNKAAGDKAMKATAFHAAAGFYGMGLSGLSKEEWAALPGKRFRLLLARAEALFLSGDPGAAAGLLDDAGALAADSFDAAAVSIIRSRILEFGGDLYGAIGEIRRSLILFGVILPEERADIQKSLEEGIGKLLAGLSRVPIENLAGLGEMVDEGKAMAMRLLAQSVPAAIQVDYALYLVATLTMMDLTLGYGLTSESCKCVADAGILTASMLGDYETGYRLGKAAFALIERLKAEAQRPAVYFSFTYVSHMREHYREALEYYGLSYAKGLETGDMQHAMYALSHKLHLMMWVGADLGECESAAHDAMAFLSESRGYVQQKLVEIVMQAVKKLRTPFGDPAELDWPKADGERLEQIRDMKHTVSLVRFSQYNAFFHYLMGDAEEAAKWNSMAEEVIFASGTDFPVPDHYLVRVLLILDSLRTRAAGEDVAALAEVEAGLAVLKKWADSSPKNFAHKHALACAEVSAYKGEPLEKTLDLYRLAASSIGKGDFQQMTALVNELEGRFWLERGDEAIGKAFLQEAHYHYLRWGAVRKTEAMERRYPFQFAARADQRGSTGGKRRTTDSGLAVSNEFLDIGSLTKSVQAISSEIKTEGLLKTLIGIVMENAGAQKGCILLDYGDGKGLRVEARRGSTAEEAELVDSLPYRQSEDLCLEIAECVERSREIVVLSNAAAAGPFRDNPYIREHGVKSLLCLPVLHQNALRGVLYLENNLSDGVFTEERLVALKVLAAQASISMEIARLYARMEEKVAERTRQLNQANERLQELALIDPLTNLNNRRYFLEYIVSVAQRHVQRAKRNRDDTEQRSHAPLEAVIGVFLVDIDNFKEVNDRWGHAAGDSVLVAISRTLKSLVRSDDFIVRWGGEEFLIILNDTRPEYLDRFAQKALKAISSLSIRLAEGKTLTRTCSIGYARFPFAEEAPDSLTLEQTIKLSDHAMYAAKRAGRNRAVRLFWKGGFSDGLDPSAFLEAMAEAPESVCDRIGEMTITTGAQDV